MKIQIKNYYKTLSKKTKNKNFNKQYYYTLEIAFLKILMQITIFRIEN